MHLCIVGSQGGCCSLNIKQLNFNVMKKVNKQVQVTSHSNVLNSIILTGFVGADAIVKSYGSQKLARFNLAVNEYHKNQKGEIIKKTNWFTITLWNGHAELAEKEVKKGNKVTVIGKLQTNVYDSHDGTKRYTTDIHVNELNIKQPTEAVA